MSLTTANATAIASPSRSPDVNLRVAIAEALGKDPGTEITETDMQRLTRLHADDKGIRDLTGLEYATQLQRIELRRNQISDLTPIAGLTRLNNIKLRGNLIRDVSPLANLTNVDWLGLEGNEITDFSPLKELIKLNGIGISGNPGNECSTAGESDQPRKDRCLADTDHRLFTVGKIAETLMDRVWQRRCS